MNVPKNFALRKNRSGKGLLPPNPTRWEQEHNALDLRHELNLPLSERLPHDKAFELLEEVYVLPHRELNLEASVANYFTGQRANRWSGMCIEYPAGPTLVIYNDSHPPLRVRATLMEEFFHLWLEHKPSRVRILANGEGKRDFNGDIETEAYGSGAAALVPYQPLKQMLQRGDSIGYIADHFLVSEQLIQFRIQISRLARGRSQRKAA
jgi:Zn-dependent peptidase ImmA (M78 family)